MYQQVLFFLSIAFHNWHWPFNGLPKELMNLLTVYKRVPAALFGLLLPCWTIYLTSTMEFICNHFQSNFIPQSSRNWNKKKCRLHAESIPFPLPLGFHPTTYNSRALWAPIACVFFCGFWRPFYSYTIHIQLIPFTNHWGRVSIHEYLSVLATSYSSSCLPTYSI